MFNWLLLALSIVFETVGALLMQYSTQSGQSLGLMVMYLLIAVSYGLLSIAVKKIPLSTAYALWESIGIILITIGSVYLFGEAISSIKILGIGVLIVATLLIKSGTQAPSTKGA